MKKFISLFLLCLFTVSLSACTSNNAKSYDSLVNSVEGFYNGKIENIETLLPKMYYENEGVDNYDEAIKLLSPTFNSMVNEFKNQYGDNYKIKFKVSDKQEVTEETFDEIKEYIKNEYGVEEKSFKKAYKLKIQITIKGSEGELTDKDSAYVVEIDGNWFFVNSSGEFIIPFFGD